ncbi:MAG: hypothetical protein CBE00_11390 [Planctomycetaceae bacterium TMED240]|nr:hypothetical protein [Rhodopirellula sp.]OUX05242.1 MAG: hypothetical protein CBE00_11390 [Planctomycetaceae bacterium TMED240]
MYETRIGGKTIGGSWTNASQTRRFTHLFESQGDQHPVGFPLEQIVPMEQRRCELAWQSSAQPMPPNPDPAPT